MTLEEKLKTYRALKMQADDLLAEIKEEIIEQKSDVKTDGVSAIYRTGRKTYKYDVAGREHADEDTIKKHTSEKIDWKAVCKDAGLVNIPFVEGEPSVAIKIEDDNPFE